MGSKGRLIALKGKMEGVACEPQAEEEEPEILKKEKDDSAIDGMSEILTPNASASAIALLLTLFTAETYAVFSKAGQLLTAYSTLEEKFS